jgi:DNA-binding IclR family transcriptional regulator
MHKSTIHRLLATLENKRFLTRDKTTGLYKLGFLFIELASIMLKDLDVQHWALPYLQELSRNSGETVDLAVLDDSHVVYLHVIESTQRVKIAAAIGEKLPSFCTATGKAFLAYLPEDRVQMILDQDLTRYTDNTLVSPGSLIKDLHETRLRGFAISEQEYEKDINAVAAPIMNANGCPIAAIAIVGPTYRMSRDRMMELGRMICETVKLISRDVGISAIQVILPQSTGLCIEENQ